ncbi:MAG: hypothetical protein R3F24_00130 [Gammaproteobacteria bacterium]
MTSRGKLNLFAMLLLPTAAALAAFIVFGNVPAAALTVFGLNLVPMLIGGLVAALLLRVARRAGSDIAGSIALWPSLIPAVAGAAGYLFRAFVPDPVAPASEYISGPQYLLMAVVVLSVVAWSGSLIARRR